MAIRKIRYIGDDVLGKPCKPVKKMTPSLQVLIEDMFETMYDANGVGLAAPQMTIPLFLLTRKSWRPPVSRPMMRDVSVFLGNVPQSPDHIMSRSGLWTRI